VKRVQNDERGCEQRGKDEGGEEVSRQETKDMSDHLDLQLPRIFFVLDPNNCGSMTGCLASSAMLPQPLWQTEGVSETMDGRCGYC
jgi:hypothetical protein